MGLLLEPVRPADGILGIFRQMRRAVRQVTRGIPRALRWLVLAALPFLVVACGGGSSSSPPTDVTAVAGDGQVTLSWNAEDGVEYWVFYAPDPSISPQNFVNVANARVIRGATSPQVIPGLVNGTTYWFTLNGRTDNGPGGSGTPAIAATPRPAGSVWVAGTPLGTTNMNAVSFGLGAGYVAVGAAGTVYSSADGVTWTAQTSGVTGDLYAVDYLNGTYVATGANGTTLRSVDAITWTSTVAGNQSLYGIVQQGTAFVAVGASGTILTSADGANWLAQTSATTVDLRGVAVGNSLFVAVGDKGTILTSSDSVTWTPQNSGVSSNLRSVAYGLGRFVAVGDQGTIVTSTDATTWTTVTNPTTDTLDAVAAGSQFVAAGVNGRILTSTDGLTWQAATSGVNVPLFGLAWSGTGYAAVGAAGTNLTSR